MLRSEALAACLAVALAGGCGDGPGAGLVDAAAQIDADPVGSNGILALAPGSDLPTSGPSSFAEAADGARLQAIWWRADGGLAVFAGWFDRQLGSQCTFQRFADG